MDKIELHVAQHAGAALGRSWHATFGMAGGTIGRGGQNKLVLPDVDAGVARVHAMVRLDSERAYIANLCERRAVWVDGLEVRSGQEVVLPLGAQVQIGPYVLQAAQFGAPKVSEAETAARLGLESKQPPKLPPATEPLRQPEKVSAGPSKLASTPNPWADIEPQVRDPYSLLPKSAPSATQHLFDGPSRALPALHGASANRSMLIPSDFDPFARDIARDAQAKDPWAGGLQATSLAEVANLKGDGLLQALPLTGRFDSSIDNPAHPGLPKRLEPSNELDPLVLFGDDQEDVAPAMAPSPSPTRGNDLVQLFSMPKESRTAAATVQPMPDTPVPRRTQGLDLSMFGADANPNPTLGFDLPALAQPPAAASWVAPARHPSNGRLFIELSESATWPIVDPTPAPTPMPTPVVTVPPHAAAASATPATGDELARAFLEGAGLSHARVELNLSADFMRSFGEAFRVAVEGTIDLLAARSEIKREFRAGVTIMASGANNPLKFLPNADGVIMQLAGQGFPGFMQPVPAMKEAYRDLQVHQLGLMAGIRAAYTAALTRFDPIELEKQTQPRLGLLRSFSSLRRKAALWDDYKQGYTRIRQHAEDDLKAFSGQTFVNAYEAAADAAKEAL